MPIRSIVGAVLGRALKPAVKDTVDQSLRTQPFARQSDVRELRQAVEKLGGGAEAGAGPGLEAIEARLTKLEKKIDMISGAVQAATAQIVQVKNTAQQANQKATSALSTAESVADGLAELEDAAGGEPDLSAVLDGSVGDVKAVLETGALDDHLDALQARESAGKDRKGVRQAIDARR